jgi:hypothetical protein
MNMGIEQYVYEALDRPDIEIVKPVSYGLESHAAVDWINVENTRHEGAAHDKDRKLVLIGGCHLLQLASYCSTNRAEFVNACQDGTMMRFDDPGFILSDRAELKKNKAIRRLPSWQYEDAVRFDEAVATSDLVLISLWASLNARDLKVGPGVTVGLKQKRIALVRDDRPKWFDRNIEDWPLSNDAKLARIVASFDEIARLSPPGAQVFLLSCYTKGVPEADVPKRKLAYNDACRAYCEANQGKFRYIDLDDAIPPGHLISAEHFSRAGYFALARYILDIAAAPAEPMAVAS